MQYREIKETAGSQENVSWDRRRSSVPPETLKDATDKYCCPPDRGSFDEKLREVRRRVIDVGSRLLPSNTTYPAHLNTELRNSAIHGAGKLVRPCISVLTAYYTGGDVSTAFNYGWAIELLHLSSLILDDLPSMDNSRFRRGKLTIHVSHGESFAILLAAQAHNVAMQIIGKRSPNSTTALSFFNAAHEALGGMGLIGGQTLDLEFQTKEPNYSFAEGYRKKIGFRDLWTMCAHFKTASLFRLAIYAGCLTSDLNHDDIENICRAGERIGLVFQLLDDEIDQDTANTMGSHKFQTLMTREQRLQEAADQREAWQKEIEIVLGSRGRNLCDYIDFIVPVKKNSGM